MLAVMTTTHTLAALIGLYFVAGGVGLLVDRNNASKLMRELTAQPMFGYLGGLIAFAIGGAIVGVHNNWNSLLSGFVSLVGWLSLLEGVLMLARLTLSSIMVSAFGFGTLLAGVVLVWAAFIG